MVALFPGSCQSRLLCVAVAVLLLLLRKALPRYPPTLAVGALSRLMLSSQYFDVAALQMEYLYDRMPCVGSLTQKLVSPVGILGLHEQTRSRNVCI